jgi:branched-subunit amino acid ABC-type transport system permease component
VLAQLLINGIVVGCSYALNAFGFALIYYTKRTFHFAHGAVYTFSAYAFYTLSARWELPLWLLMVCVLVLTALVGMALDEVVYEPLVRRNSSALGTNPRSVRRLVFGLGSALVSVAAVLKVADAGVDPHAGMTLF